MSNKMGIRIYDIIYIVCVYIVKILLLFFYIYYTKNLRYVKGIY